MTLHNKLKKNGMQIGAKGIENIFMIIVLKKNSKNKKIQKIPFLFIY